MDSDDEEIAIAAITAAGKIGGDTALEALIAKLNSNHADAATKALLSFNGKINNNIMKALDADKAIRIAALNLASTRSMDAVSYTHLDVYKRQQIRFCRLYQCHTEHRGCFLYEKWLKHR